ncbi:uncharacterized protein GJ701_001188 [Geothlypis trichas]
MLPRSAGAWGTGVGSGSRVGGTQNQFRGRGSAFSRQQCGGSGAGGAGSQGATTEAGDVSFAANFAGAASGVAPDPAAQMRDTGKACGASREDSRAQVRALGSASFPGVTAVPHAGTMPRRKGRALMMNPEAGMRRSARIAAQGKIKATGKPRAPSGDADVLTEGEGRSGPDVREEISEAERNRFSDISLGAVGGVPEYTRAEEEGGAWEKRARSPVTSRARRGRGQSSTSWDSTPSPVSVLSAPIPEVQSPSSPERHSYMQSPLLARSKVAQTRSKQKLQQQLKSKVQQSAEPEGPIEFVTSAQESKQMTAPPSGGMTTLQDPPDLFARATTPSRGGTAAMQQFFQATYIKKTTSKGTTTKQQMNYPSTSGVREFEETLDETQIQGKDIIQITASEGIPAWMFSVAEAAKSFLHSLETAKKTKQREFQPSYAELGARPKTSRQKMQTKESPMTSTVPLCMQLPMELPEEEQQPVETMDWDHIRKELSKEKDLLQGSGDLTMPVTYDAQGHQKSKVGKDGS